MLPYIVFVLSAKINNEESNKLTYNTTKDVLVYTDSSIPGKEKKNSLSEKNLFSPYKKVNVAKKSQDNGNKNYKLLFEPKEKNDNSIHLSEKNNTQLKLEGSDINLLNIQSDFTEKEDSEFDSAFIALKKYILRDNALSHVFINNFIITCNIPKISSDTYQNYRYYIRTYNFKIKDIVEKQIPILLNCIKDNPVDNKMEKCLERHLLFLQEGFKYLYKFFYDDKTCKYNINNLLGIYVQLYVELDTYFKNFHFLKVFLEFYKEINVIYRKTSNFTNIEKETKILGEYIRKIYRDFYTYRIKVLNCIHHLKCKIRGFYYVIN